MYVCMYVSVCMYVYIHVCVSVCFHSLTINIQYRFMQLVMGRSAD